MDPDGARESCPALILPRDLLMPCILAPTSLEPDSFYIAISTVPMPRQGFLSPYGRATCNKRYVRISSWHLGAFASRKHPSEDLGDLPYNTTSKTGDLNGGPPSLHVSLLAIQCSSSMYILFPEFPDDVQIWLPRSHHQLGNSP